MSPSTAFEILDIDGSRTGEFAGLTEGSLDGNFGLNLFIYYQAGDGNDIGPFTNFTDGETYLHSNSTEVGILDELHGYRHPAQNRSIK